MKDKNKFNILIVDDELDLLESLCMLLELENYNIMQSNSGHDALLQVQKNPNFIDLVLSDIRMANGTGDELLRNIKKLNLTKPEVILMTGHSLFTKEEALKEGAYDFLAKPIDFVNLIKLIEKVRLKG